MRNIIKILSLLIIWILININLTFSYNISDWEKIINSVIKELKDSKYSFKENEWSSSSASYHIFYEWKMVWYIDTTEKWISMWDWWEWNWEVWTFWDKTDFTKDDILNYFYELDTSGWIEENIFSIFSWLDDILSEESWDSQNETQQEVNNNESNNDSSNNDQSEYNFNSNFEYDYATDDKPDYQDTYTYDYENYEYNYDYETSNNSYNEDNSNQKTIKTYTKDEWLQYSFRKMYNEKMKTVLMKAVRNKDLDQTRQINYMVNQVSEKKAINILSKLDMIEYKKFKKWYIIEYLELKLTLKLLWE